MLVGGPETVVTLTGRRLMIGMQPGTPRRGLGTRVGAITESSLASGNWAAEVHSAVGPILAIAVGAFCLLVPVLLNGFPFMFPDTSDYLIFTPRLFRSPFYGLFIFLFHLNRFIWAPIVAQAVIASHLIWVLTRIHAGRRPQWAFLVSIFVLTVASSLPFVVGFLMPDIFTGIMILTIYLIGFHFWALSRIEQVYFLLLGCVAISAHTSHLVLVIALLPVVVAIHLVLRTPMRLLSARVALLLVPIVLTILATLLNNVLVHRAFTLSTAARPLLLANMIEFGPAARYLQEACPAAGYKLCAAVDSLPTSGNVFLWGGGLFEQLGGFAELQDEAGAIVSATIRTRPWDVLDMVLHAATLSFVTHAPGAELVSLTVPAEHWDDRYLADIIEKKFGNSAVRAYRDSLQSRGAVPREFLRTVDDVSFPAAVIAVAVTSFLAWRRNLRSATALPMLVTMAFVVNNVICAFGSGVYDRYQTRVTWLFALSALMIFWTLVRPRSSGQPSVSLSVD